MIKRHACNSALEHWASLSKTLLSALMTSRKLFCLLAWLALYPHFSASQSSCEQIRDKQQKERGHKMHLILHIGVALSVVDDLIHID